jgi:hypothetical protein
MPQHPLSVALELPDEQVANVEKSLLGFCLPQLGHLISWSLSFILRRKENLSPQALHSYSYMGILISYLPLLLR